MHFHVASMWSPLTLASQQVVQSFKFFHAGSVFIIKLLSGHLISQFSKVILFWWFYCYNFYHANFDRKLINQAFR